MRKSQEESQARWGVFFAKKRSSTQVVLPAQEREKALCLGVDPKGAIDYFGAMEIVPWNQEQIVEDGHYRAFKIGDLCLVIVKRGSEWQLSHFRTQVLPFPERGLYKDLSKDLTWTRWEGSEEDSVCLIRPTLPKLPVISQPTSTVTLPPGAQARFFIGVPACVEIVASCDGMMMPLGDYPTVCLSYTWKGVPKGEKESTTVGEVCMSLETKARRVFDLNSFSEGVIICTIEISNHLKKPLQFSRMSLITDHLSIYLSDTHPWANYCRYDIYENRSLDAVLYASGPPREAGKNHLLATPRVPVGNKPVKTHALSSLLEKFTLKI